MQVTRTFLRARSAALVLAVMAGGCAGPLGYAPAPAIALEPASLAAARQASAALEDHFALNGDFHPNDLIRITFPYYPLMTGDQRVQLSGLISPPMLAPLQTKGMTTAQVQSRLTALYSAKLTQPAVSISVLQYNRPPPIPQVFVLGEVAKPGAYPFRDDSSVFEGLANAGGGNRDADLTRVVVLQPRDGQLVASMVDLKAVLTGDRASLGYLSPFSVLIVPPTQIARDVDRARQIRQIIGFNGFNIGSALTLIQP